MRVQTILPRPHAAGLALLVSLALVGCSSARSASNDGAAGGSAGEGGTGEAGTGGITGTGGSAGIPGSSGSAGSLVGGAGGASGTGGGSVGGPLLEPVRIRGGDPHDLYLDFETSGEGLASLEGRVVTVRLGDPPINRLASAQARVVDGRFALSLPQTLEAGLYKTKIVHFDVDGDGRCGPGDQVWVDRSSSQSAPGVVVRLFGPGATGTGLAGPASVAGTLSPPDDEICGRIDLCGPYVAETPRPSLDLKITGSGFDAHNDLPIRLVTRSSGTATLRGLGRGVVIGGRFTIYVPNGYQRGTDQEIFWFVDVDRDGKCGDAGADHLGHATVARFDPVGNEPVEVSVSDGHSAASPGGADVCAAMQPLSTMAVTGSGFDAHERSIIYFWTRTSNGARLAAGSTNIAAGGGLSFAQRPFAYERGSNQEVLWFVDAQGGPARYCDSSTGDHVGYRGTGNLEPGAADVVSFAISDNHVETTAGGEYVCALMNGCR